MLMISALPQRVTGAGEGKEARGGAAPGDSGPLPTRRRYSSRPESRIQRRIRIEEFTVTSHEELESARTGRYMTSIYLYLQCTAMALLKNITKTISAFQILGGHRST